LNINAYAKDVKIRYAAYAERHHGGDLAEDHIQLPLGDAPLEVTYIQPYREALEPSAGSAAGARNGVTIGTAGPPLPPLFAYLQVQDAASREEAGVEGLPLSADIESERP
jgi:hypothetical protein